MQRAGGMRLERNQEEKIKSPHPVNSQLSPPDPWGPAWTAHVARTEIWRKGKTEESLKILLPPFLLPPPFLLYFFITYTSCPSSLCRIERKKKQDKFHKKPMILLLTDKTTTNSLMSIIPDSFFYACTSHMHFMGSYHSHFFVTWVLHLTEHHKHLSMSANIQQRSFLKVSFFSPSFPTHQIILLRHCFLWSPCSHLHCILPLQVWLSGSWSLCGCGSAGGPITHVSSWSLALFSCSSFFSFS